jgi:hypothetical protein
MFIHYMYLIKMTKIVQHIILKKITDIELILFFSVQMKMVVYSEQIC